MVLTMNRSINIILVFLLVACDKLGINQGENAEQCDDYKIQKITQTFSFDPSFRQYGIYYYDKICNIKKYEFYGSQFGEDRLSYYANYDYVEYRLNLVATYVLMDQQPINTLIENYAYDELNRISAISISALSEIDNTWYEDQIDFFYDENNRLFKTATSDGSYSLYYYNHFGNVTKYDYYPIHVEYVPPLTIIYTYDDKNNPLYLHDRRYSMAQYLSPNNILNWESYSPETGSVVSKSSFRYDYNSKGFPVFATETIITPLTENQPDTMMFYTSYEYAQ